ncbi:MAG: Fe-S cluster assembly protein SufD [Planctomycetales bacterium]|nr:Fe-S cluster assembly protein SufD [Planctomycetales bacterium]
MTTTAPSSFTDESFDTFLDARDEPVWLAELRREAWAKFQELNWPARNEEEWMRTDIRLFKLDRYQMPAGARPAPRAPLKTGVELAGWVDENGDSRLLDEYAAKGVVCCSLEDACRSHGDLVREHLFRQLPIGYDRFAALHAAFWANGAFIYVPRGVTVELPLHVVASLADGQAETGHLLVVLEDGAAATLLSEMHGDGGGLHCGGVELSIGRGANLRFVELQEWGQETWQFGHEYASLQADASLQWTLAAMGTRLAKVNQTVSLAGPGATSQVNGVLFTEGRQHVAYHTLQHHEAPHCRSDFLYKSALQDKSRTVWRGMIKVDPVAQKTDGYQRNDNLLLSPDARADSIPGLEIEADDVRCTHGSTSGRVDEELLFYAQCRGFTRNEAVRMVVSGFFQQIFDRITIESVRDALGEAIARRVRNYE